MTAHAAKAATETFIVKCTVLTQDVRTGRDAGQQQNLLLPPLFLFLSPFSQCLCCLSLFQGGRRNPSIVSFLIIRTFPSDLDPVLYHTPVLIQTGQKTVQYYDNLLKTGRKQNNFRNFKCSLLWFLDLNTFFFLSRPKQTLNPKQLFESSFQTSTFQTDIGRSKQIAPGKLSLSVAQTIAENVSPSALGLKFTYFSFVPER